MAGAKNRELSNRTPGCPILHRHHRGHAANSTRWRAYSPDCCQLRLCKSDGCSSDMLCVEFLRVCPKSYAGLHSFLNMSLMEARRRKASALRLRFSQSFASLRHRPSLVAELGAPIGRGGEFLEPGGCEVAAGERRAQSFERFGEAAGAEAAVCDDSHSASVRERRAETASFGRATRRRSPFDVGR